jgi:hypothetical protein
MLNPRDGGRVQESALLSSKVSKALASHNSVGNAYYTALQNWARTQADPTTDPAEIEAADLAAMAAFEEMWRVDMRDGPVLANVPLEAWPDHVLPFTPDLPEELSPAKEIHRPDWVIVPRSEVRRSKKTIRSLGSLLVSKAVCAMNKLHIRRS